LTEENLRKGRKDEGSLSFIDQKPPTNENTDVFRGKEATLTGKDAEISRMDYLIKKYKRDISEQTTQMQELKRTVQSYDLKIEKLVKEKTESRMTASYDQLLKQRDKEVVDLKERLLTFEAELERRFAHQSEQLQAALIGSQARVRELEEEGRRLKQRVHELETHADVAAVDALRKERDELRTKHADLSKQLSASSNASTSAFIQLVGQIKELEDMQLRLLTENSQLKEDLIAEQRRYLSVSSKDTDAHHIIEHACRDARQLQREIGQLTHLCDTMKRGADINLSLLLAPSVSKESEGESSLKEEMSQLRSQMNGLRTLVSDCYAEQCGSQCLTQ
jgi:chromosome segregation ATPase